MISLGFATVVGMGNVNKRNRGQSREMRRVGATIRALREARGATLDQFANKIGLSRPALSNIEAGRRRLRPELLPKVADALGVPQIAIMWTDYDNTAA